MSQQTCCQTDALEAELIGAALRYVAVADWFERRPITLAERARTARRWTRSTASKRSCVRPAVARCDVWGIANSSWSKPSENCVTRKETIGE